MSSNIEALKDNLIYDGDVNDWESWLNIKKLGFIGVSGTFYCSSVNNKEKNTLKGSPLYVGKDFDCSGIGLYNLEHCPLYIGRTLIASNNNIDCLDFFPENVRLNINLSNNNITHIPENFLKEVAGYVDLNTNKIKELTSSSLINIGGDFDISNNKIVLFKNMPEFVGGEFYCEENPIHFKKWIDTCPSLFDMCKSFLLSVNKLDYDLYDNETTKTMSAIENNLISNTSNDELKKCISNTSNDELKKCILLINKYDEHDEYREVTLELLELIEKYIFENNIKYKDNKLVRKSFKI